MYMCLYKSNTLKISHSWSLKFLSYTPVKVFECETFNIFFHMTAKILAETQLCISVPLKSTTETPEKCVKSV